MILKRSTRLLSAAVASSILLLCIFNQLALAGGDEKSLRGGHHGDTTNEQGVGGKLKACIDPHTGKLISPQERPECLTNLQDAKDKAKGNERSPSDERVDVETLPNGSKRLDLKGRYQQQSLSGIKSSGSLGARLALVDPITGGLVTGDVQRQLKEREDLQIQFQAISKELNRLMANNQDVEGLASERQRGGQLYLNLKGRFKSPLVARIEGGNRVVIQHMPITSP